MMSLDISISRIRRHHSYARNLCSLARNRSILVETIPPPSPQTHVGNQNNTHRTLSVPSSNAQKDIRCKPLQSRGIRQDIPSPAVERHVKNEGDVAFQPHRSTLFEVPTHIVLSLAKKIDDDLFILDSTEIGHDDGHHSLAPEYRENKKPERKASFFTPEMSSCSTLSLKAQHKAGPSHREFSSVASLPTTATTDSGNTSFDHESFSTLGEEETHTEDVPRSIFSDFWDAKRRNTPQERKPSLCRSRTAPSPLSSLQGTRVSCMRVLNRRRAASFSGGSVLRPSMERRVTFNPNVSVRQYDRPRNNISCSVGWSKAFIDSPRV